LIAIFDFAGVVDKSGTLSSPALAKSKIDNQKIE
jgi:hypothetical protein